MGNAHRGQDAQGAGDKSQQFDSNNADKNSHKPTGSVEGNERKESHGSGELKSYQENRGHAQNQNRATSWQGDSEAPELDNTSEAIPPQQIQDVGNARNTNPTNQQPSGSQHNEWQEKHANKSSTDKQQQRQDQYENSSDPSLENRASEDDELGEEMIRDYREGDFTEDNVLERNDQDYRDGDNRSGEDQDDDDELRNGK
jgi:hypothetical protein